MVFSGLTANSAFQLYIYTQGDEEADDRTLTVSVNGGSPVTTDPADGSASTFILNQNYLRLTGTATAAGQVSIVWGGTGDDEEKNLNAIQLQTSTIDLPVPGTIALLALGALGIARSARGRQTRRSAGQS